MSARKATIVGSGFVGQSWAMIFAGAGYQVSLYDNNKAVLDGALGKIETELTKLSNEGLIRGTRSVAEHMALMSTTSDLAEAVKGACFIQENVFEDVDIKTDVFKQIDAVMTDGQIVGSSASCLAASSFTEGMKHRDCCMVTHPCNPPYYCLAVEVVPSKWTRQELTDKAMKILEEVGQVPVLVNKEIFGFVLNRIQYAIIGQCLALVKDGVCSVDGVNRIVSEALGMRYAFLGPLEVNHLNAPNGFSDYAERYGPSIMKVLRSYGPPVEFTPEIVKKVQDSLEEVIPKEKFQDTLQWRNTCLAKLAQIKKAAKEDK